jgi:DNA-binding response OmpR family regulator
MAEQTILVADDESNIRNLARMYLEKDGYRVRTAVDGAAALAQIEREPPDLLVLDLMMPEVDGWEVCRRLRAEGDLPILMLTARDDDIDKIVGLEMGADDYLTKPFNPRELVARVRAILRRADASAGAVPAPDETRRCGDVVVAPAAREVAVAGEKVSLRAKEFDLLLTLIDHRNQVLSREQLLNLVWGYDFYGQTRTVDVHIAHLRDKLEESDVTIETVWGVGYKLAAPDS